MQQLLYTPETSGGLIATVAPEKVDILVNLFNKNNELCQIIGKVYEGEPQIKVS